MSPETLLAFAGASLALCLVPGPMVSYIVYVSTSAGLAAAGRAVAGSMAASAVHLAVVAAGLSALLSAAGEAFFWLRWAGAAYLIFLGLRALRARADTESAGPQRRASRTGLAGFLVNLFNPKALIFHAAFLPQFVDPAAPAAPQLAALAAIFLAVSGATDFGWALGAARARARLARLGRWRERIAGIVLVGAGLALAAARK